LRIRDEKYAECDARLSEECGQTGELPRPPLSDIDVFISVISAVSDDLLASTNSMSVLGP